MHSIFQSTNSGPETSPANIQKKKHNSASTIQTKLTIGQPNDKYEQEADRVADQVVSAKPTAAENTGRMPVAAIQSKAQLQKMNEEEIQTKSFPTIMRMPREEIQKRIEKTAHEDLQKKPTDNTARVAPNHIQTQIEQSKGAGSPLSSSTRSFMESRIGADFGNVRIHNDSNAHKLNAKLNAQAFAVGNNVFFNQGKYNPESQSGKHLLAHELTHTVQQGSAIHTRIQKQDSSDGQTKMMANDIKYIKSILRTALTSNASSVSMTWQKSSGGLLIGFKLHGKNGQAGLSSQSAINDINGLVKIFYNSTNKEASLNFTRGEGGWLSSFVPTPLPKKKPSPKTKPEIIKRVGSLDERISIPDYPGWTAVKGDDWLSKVRELPHFIKVTSNAEGNKLTVAEGKYKGQAAAYKKSKPDIKPVVASERKFNRQWSFIHAQARPAVNLIAEFREDSSTRKGRKFTKGVIKGVKGEKKFVTDTNNPVPLGKHDLEIPDYQHTIGHTFTHHGSTWFRIGHSGDRYFHPGNISNGCITVLSASPMWEHIYHALIEARKDDKSVGTITVIDKRPKP